jgi:class 3 adenylate cyclase
MVRCPRCAAEWPDGARFCGECGAALERPCPACGVPVPPAARFCLSCGAAVEGDAHAAGPPSRARTAAERRAVTILFADLVGFTERSDRADPEDVRTTLVPFHARAKEDIERYGGRLDKFIGDAVMGVFGAPVAHEDDPLRAVRAALRILHGIDELRAHDPALQIRVAVNTGEAVVALGEGPQIGEAVAGDVVNTASRMQSLAPPGGLVIGEATYRHVRDRVVADRLAPATVKGKAEPLVVWHVLGEHDPSTSARVRPASFVGRDRELALLSDAIERAATSRTPHVATIVGEAGMGKSRLVDELRAVTGGRAVWLEGRCLPYGEAVTLAPVADVVRAAAGIGAADAPAEAAERLRSAFDDRDDAETSGSVNVLLATLGAVDPDDGGELSAGDIGTAVAALIETVGRPVVAAVQDLHWADDLALDVLGAAARTVGDVPLVVLGTARPEFFDRETRWPPPGLEATTLRLEALSAEQTEALVVSMIADATLDPDARATLLERAGGNPLFALEYVRMLVDGVAEAGEAPDTIQALIAARIDTIPASARSRLIDASVGGTEFWPAFLATVGGVDERAVRDDLGVLVQRGLVASAPTSIEGQPAFRFSHDLIREVAYGRLPRIERARRHVAAADWLEAAAGADRPELLAQHLATAFELASAARDDPLIRQTRGRAARWLVETGRRTLAADPRGAFAVLDRAAAIAEDDTSERADGLLLSGLAGRRSGLLGADEVLDRYLRAEAIRRVLDDPSALGEVLTRTSSQLAVMGRADESHDRLGEAIRLLERTPTDRRLAAAYAHRAESHLFAGDRSDAIADAERTLGILGADTSDELVVMALHVRGDARCSLGDAGGLDDLRRALEVSTATQRAGDIVTSESYLADWTLAFEGPARTWPHYERGIALAEQSGVVSQGLWSKAGALFSLYELERYADVLELSADVVSLGADRVDATVWVFAQSLRSEALLDLDRRDEVVDPSELLERARVAGDVQAVAPALLTAGRVALLDGRRDEAEALLAEFADVTREGAPEFRESVLARAARLALALGAREVLAELVRSSGGELPHHANNLASARAALLELDGDRARARDAYLAAERAWNAFGSPREAAFARAGAERCSATT